MTELALMKLARQLRWIEDIEWKASEDGNRTLLSHKMNDIEAWYLLRLYADVESSTPIDDLLRRERVRFRGAIISEMLKGLEQAFSVSLSDLAQEGFVDAWREHYSARVSNALEEADGAAAFAGKSEEELDNSDYVLAFLIETYPSDDAVAVIVSGPIFGLMHSEECINPGKFRAALKSFSIN
jgi:hypothetical protein